MSITFVFREKGVECWPNGLIKRLVLLIFRLNVVRLIQLIGAFTIPWRGGNGAILVLFGGWIVYILAANGPIASPKYRLPIEPVLMVSLGAGLVRLRSWFGDTAAHAPRSPVRS